MSSKELDLSGIAEMPECELVYRLYEDYPDELYWYWELLHHEIRKRLGISWWHTLNEYRDNMIAEYWLLHRKYDE